MEALSRDSSKYFIFAFFLLLLPPCSSAYPISLLSCLILAGGPHGLVEHHVLDLGLESFILPAWSPFRRERYPHQAPLPENFERIQDLDPSHDSRGQIVYESLESRIFQEGILHQ